MKNAKKSSARLLSLLLVVLVVIGLFAGCKKEPSEPSGDKTTTTTTQADGGLQDPSLGGDGDAGDVTDGNTTQGNQGGNSVTTTTKGQGGNSGNTPQKPPVGNFDPYADMPSSVRGKVVKVALWWTPNAVEKEQLDAAKSKLGIAYKPVTIPSDLYNSKLTSMVASGDAPDMAAVGSDFYPMSIINGLFQSLDKGNFDIENDPAYDLAQMEAFKWGGKYYGVQCKTNMTYQRYCLYYNETMFNNRGVKTPLKYWKEGNWNWDTFAELCKKMTHTKNGETIWGYSSDDAEILGFLLAADTDFVTVSNDKISNNIKSKKVLDVLGNISDLRANGYWDPEASGSSKFINGRAAMMGNRSWMIETTTGLASTSMTDKWGVVPMPSPKGQAETIGINPCVWGIPTGAKNVTAASYFIRHFLDWSSVDFKSVIAGEQQLEMFNYLTNAKNKRITVSMGITTYLDTANYYQLLWAARESKNDIPVFMDSMVPVIDGIISKIESDAK